MITSVLKTWFQSMRALLRNIGVLIVFTALYALLLATLYFFIATREATVWQVMITLAGLVVIPAEFFILQAAIIDRTKQQKFNWRGILIDAVKLFLVTIPILLLGWLVWYLLNKWQAHFPPPAPPVTLQRITPPPPPVHWPTLLFATLRCLLFGVALPLMTIHLWIGVAGTEIRTLFAGGAGPFFRRIGKAFARAFASDSALTYAFGLIVFFAIPYALLFIPLTIKGNKTEFAFFIFRLVLVFAFTLIGWVVTLSALTKLPSETTTAETKSEAKPLALSEEPAG